MKFCEMLYELKAGSEFVVKGVRVITYNVQAAAFGRTLRTERCNDDVASWFDGVCYLAHVRRTFLGFGQEVEYRTVMPHVVLMPREGKRRNVAAKPTDSSCAVTKSRLGHFQCGQRNIQNGKLVIPPGPQIVD